jgi:ABC-type Na+ efflux pump permease subunit
MLAVMDKDFKDFLKNRALLLSLLAPVVVAVGFVRLLENSTVRPTVRLAVVGRMPDKMRVVVSRSGIFEVQQAATLTAAEDLVSSGKADAAVGLPDDLVPRLEAGDLPSVDLVMRNGASPAVLAGIDALGEVLRLYAGQMPPVKVNRKTVGVPEVEARRALIVDNWLLFVLLMGFSVVAASLVEEREHGTLAAILVTPARLGAVLAGKGLAGWVMCVAASLAMLLLCGVATAPYGGKLSMLCAGAAFVVALGLLMGSIFPNMASANAGIAVVFLLLFVPVFLGEALSSYPLVSAVGQTLPSQTLVDGLNKTLVDAGGFEAARGAASSLLAWALACATASFYCVRAARNR